MDTLLMFIGMIALIGAIVFFIGMIGTLVIKKYRSRLKKFAIIFGSCLSVFIVSLTLSHIFYPITAEQQAEMDKKAEEKKQLAAKKEEEKKSEKEKLEEEKNAEKTKKEQEKKLAVEAKEKEKAEKEAAEKAEEEKKIKQKEETDRLKAEEAKKKAEEEQRKQEEEAKKKAEEEQRKQEEEVKKKAEAEARKAETQQKVLESNYRSAYATHSKKLTDSLNQTGNLLINNKIGNEEWTIKLAASLIMLQDVTENPPNVQVPDKFKEVNSLYMQALEKFNQSAKLTPEALDEGNTNKMQKATNLMNDGGEILKSANTLLKEIM
ncbi:hypothetical protein OCD85_13275 [Bacillus pacificus]|uniref:hypothetical protein n=1 Tax=Bacillus cereus group TaxID=86661 RepID=UPI0007A90950|nr:MULTISPECIES: hypothetical protein [Bacillus cereus group]KYP99790.1 hypothetical protein B4079_5042 [Bacillus cereus]MCC2350888.1 hypothetical protein [Bacillus pacificus]MCC2387207.1 hypothetical protein [Bacillus pacificus]MCC2468336.1 hypothetical protein [Bacillus pacificus]MCU5246709.1 hypothetical protein [Bacillus pacificus]